LSHDRSRPRPIVYTAETAWAALLRGKAISRHVKTQHKRTPSEHVGSALGVTVGRCQRRQHNNLIIKVNFRLSLARLGSSAAEIFVYVGVMSPVEVNRIALIPSRKAGLQPILLLDRKLGLRIPRRVQNGNVADRRMAYSPSQMDRGLALAKMFQALEPIL
jgi:hypothetical protein